MSALRLVAENKRDGTKDWPTGIHAGCEVTDESKECRLWESELSGETIAQLDSGQAERGCVGPSDFFVP